MQQRFDVTHTRVTYSGRSRVTISESQKPGLMTLSKYVRKTSISYLYLSHRRFIYFSPLFRINRVAYVFAEFFPSELRRHTSRRFDRRTASWRWRLEPSSAWDTAWIIIGSSAQKPPFFIPRKLWHCSRFHCLVPYGKRGFSFERTSELITGSKLNL